MQSRKWVVPVVFVLLLALLGVGAWWGWKMVTRPIPETVTECTEQQVTTLTPSQVTIRVFNGGGASGLARKVADALVERGFHSNKVDNADTAITTTVIEGSSETDPEVALLAQYYPDAEVRAHGRPDHYVDVYVGTEYTDINPEAVGEIPVESGVVCLPLRPDQLASETPTDGEGADPAAEPTA